MAKDMVITWIVVLLDTLLIYSVEKLNNVYKNKNVCISLRVICVSLEPCTPKTPGSFVYYN